MDTVWKEIEQLRGAPMAQLRARYREVFREEPRSHHREHLFRRLAWRLQAIAYGGLSEAAQQRAQEIANDADVRLLPPRGLLERTSARWDRRIPRVGAVLTRQYRGNTISVKVLRDGFEYADRRYGSLSAIAMEVTGTRWNGLAFFGLTPARPRFKGGRHV